MPSMMLSRRCLCSLPTLQWRFPGHRSLVVQSCATGHCSQGAVRFVSRELSSVEGRFPQGSCSHVWVVWVSLLKALMQQRCWLGSPAICFTSSHVLFRCSEGVVASLPLASIGPTLLGLFLSLVSSRGGHKEVVEHAGKSSPWSGWGSDNTMRTFAGAEGENAGV